MVQNISWVLIISLGWALVFGLASICLPSPPPGSFQLRSPLLSLSAADPLHTLTRPAAQATFPRALRRSRLRRGPSARPGAPVSRPSPGCRGRPGGAARTPNSTALPSCRHHRPARRGGAPDSRRRCERRTARVRGEGGGDESPDSRRCTHQAELGAGPVHPEGDVVAELRESAAALCHRRHRQQTAEQRRGGGPAPAAPHAGRRLRSGAERRGAGQAAAGSAAPPPRLLPAGPPRRPSTSGSPPAPAAAAAAGR